MMPNRQNLKLKQEIVVTNREWPWYLFTVSFKADVILRMRR